MKFSSAATYDAAAHVQHTCFETLLSFCEALTPNCILDLGCGTGTTTFRLAQHFPNATIIALDLSEDMLNFAKEHNAHPNITYVCADIHGYTPDTPVDLIVSNAAFQWLEKPEDQVDRLTRFLAKDGALVFSYFGPETFRELRRVLDTAGINVPIAADSFRRFSEPDIVKQESVTMLFPSFLALLKHIKHTGTKDKASPIFFTPKKAQRCHDIYTSLFAHVKLTYDAIYCVREKS